MAMTVKRRKDVRTPSVIMHKIADIRGGVSINTSELGGNFLREGAFLSAPTNGMCNVVKTAKVLAEVQSAGADIQVSKFHNFKVGDFVMVTANGKATAIKSIAEDKDKDTITLTEAIGAIKKDATIIEAKEASTNGATPKYTAVAIVGTGKPIEKNDNLITDAWVMAVTKGNQIPAPLADGLKGIINL